MSKLRHVIKNSCTLHTAYGKNTYIFMYLYNIYNIWRGIACGINYGMTWCASKKSMQPCAFLNDLYICIYAVILLFKHVSVYMYIFSFHVLLLCLCVNFYKLFKNCKPKKIFNFYKITMENENLKNIYLLHTFTNHRWGRSKALKKGSTLKNYSGSREKGMDFLFFNYKTFIWVYKRFFFFTKCSYWANIWNHFFQEGIDERRWF